MPQAYFVSNTSIKQNAKTTFRLLRFFPFQPYKRYDVEADLTKGAFASAPKVVHYDLSNVFAMLRALECCRYLFLTRIVPATPSLRSHTPPGR